MTWYSTSMSVIDDQDRLCTSYDIVYVVDIKMIAVKDTFYIDISDIKEMSSFSDDYSVLSLFMRYLPSSRLTLYYPTFFLILLF